MNQTSNEVVTAATDDTPETRTVRTRKKPVWREYTEALVVAGLLALIIRTFLFQAFHIPSTPVPPPVG